MDPEDLWAKYTHRYTLVFAVSALAVILIGLWWAS